MKAVITGSLLLLFLLLSGCQTLRADKEAALEAFNRGNAAREAGNYPDALMEYQQALSFDPGMLAASFNLALTHEELKDYEQADLILRDLHKQDPENLKILRALAYVSRQSGHLEPAFDYYRRALDIFEGDQKSLGGIVDVARQLERPAQAIEYQKFLIFLNDSAENHQKLALLYSDQDNFQAALSEYQLAFSLSEPDAQTSITAAQAAEKLDFFDTALSYYIQASKFDGPQKGRALFDSARLRLNFTFDYAEGFQSLKEALSSGFEDQEAIENLKSGARAENLPIIEQLISDQKNKNLEQDAQDRAVNSAVIKNSNEE